MIQRRFPRPSAFSDLLKLKRPELNPTKRRLAAAQTIYDLRDVAKRVTPRAPFDYTDGAAEAELSLARARQAFEDVEFHPAILRDVSAVDTSRAVLGGPTALPFGIAPTGFTRLMHTAGEAAGAAAAGAAGIPFSLSTVGTTSPEGVQAANPDGRNWFQLYMWKDRQRSLDVVDRAAKAGFDALLITVDVPVAGARLRDRYNGLTIPPAITLRTILNAIPRPRWWFDFLTTEPVEFATFDKWDGTVAELLDAMFDPTVNFDDLVWIRDRWPGKVVVKGIQTLADAKRVADLGVDGVLLSNHGGRQLDGVAATLKVLPEIVAAAGDQIEVLLDGGIRRGSDVAKALCLGARAVLVGRAYAYGLGAAGGPGVARAIEILRSDLIRTMKLLGCGSISELDGSYVDVPPDWRFP